MPEGTSEHKGNILTQKTGDFPNWVWLLIVGGGIAVAYFLPKIIGNLTGQSQTATSGSPFPTIPQGQIPVLPGGYSPITGPGGTLVGYGPTPTPTPISYPLSVQTRGNAPSGIGIFQAPDSTIQHTVLRTIPAGSMAQIAGPGIRDQNNVLFFPAVGGGWFLGSDLINPPTDAAQNTMQQNLANYWPNGVVV